MALWRKLFIFFLVVICFVVITAVFLNMRVVHLLAPVNAQASDDFRYVVIPHGAPTVQIADILEEAGIINSALVFRLYVRFKERDRDLLAGKYRLSPSMTTDMIIDKLQEGLVERDVLRFTIPEGYTIEQMVTLLANLVCFREKELFKENFLELAREPGASLLDDFPFLQHVPEGTYFLLEGYLFPDTYEVNRGAAAEEIIRLMLRRFEEVFNNDFQAQAAELEMSMHEIMTLASIIEREAVVPGERPVISAVFHNRLLRNHPLQSCATVQYALGEVRPVLYYVDLRVDSPFNTYRIGGLPPGPIAAPGAASIEAALNPADVDYFFFVAKQDGTGEHYFSRTFEEHRRR